MKTSIEIEYKTLITEKEYLSLLQAFDLEQNVFHQKNYYFDTPDFYLRKHRMALRIRHKNNIYKLTLKRPHEDGGIYEDSVLISEKKAHEMIANGFKPTAFDINKDVTVKATLDTFRATAPYMEGRIFFDKSTYADTVDYEVEYEAGDLVTGLRIFEDFLDEHHIKRTIGKHKIDRVYDKIGLK